MKSWRLGTVTLTGLATLSVAMAGVVSHYQARREEANLVRVFDRELQDSAALGSSYLLERFHQVDTDLRMLKEIPAVPGYVRAIEHGGKDPEGSETAVVWRERLETVFAALAKATPSYEKIRLIDPGGREVVRVNRRDGKVTRTQADRLQQVDGLDFVHEALRMAPGETRFSAISLNREHGRIEMPPRPMLRGMAAVADETGHRWGTLIINVDFGEVLHGLLAGIPRHLRTFLVSADGGFLCHPDPDRTFGAELGHPYGVSDELQGWTVPDLARTRSGSVVGETSLPRGRGRFVASRIETGPGDRERPLLLLIELPNDELTETVRKTRAQSFGSVALATLVFLGLASTAVHLAMRPLSKLTTAARALADGRYDEQLPGVWGRDLLDLRSAFQAMRSAVASREEQLQAQRLNLEELVAIATAEVRAIIQTAVSGIVAAREDGEIYVFNPSAERLFGWTAEEIVGKNLAVLMDPVTGARHDAYLRAHLETGRTEIIGRGREVLARRKDGSCFPAHVAVGYARPGRGRSFFVGFVTDISEAKRREEELRQAHLRIELSARAAGIGIWDWDVKTDSMLWDDQMYALYGVPKGASPEPLQVRLSGLHPGDRDRCRAAVQGALSGEQPYDIEFRVVWPDGTVRHLKAAAVVLRAEDGTPARMLGTSTDITGQVEASESIRRTNLELVQARTAAEDSARAKVEFLANMSHEIRTPMHAVLGLAYLLGRRDLSPVEHDMVEKIHKAGRNLLGIIDDILDFSKIEAHRLAIEKVPFRLGDVLDNLASIMASAVGEKRVEVVVSPAPRDAELLKGDPLRLGQVLINLAGNAIKFTESGEVAVSVALVDRQREPDAVRLRFSVRDTGIGIPRDELEAIFDPFTQVDASATRSVGGTGLGLSISRQLVTLMGGELRVVSEPGVGSEFTVDLTFETSPAVEAAFPELAGLRTLVVDDHPTARALLSDTVASLGWGVSTAASGREALTRLAETSGRPYDVVLMDWRMPGKDGLETATEIRSRYQEETLPIVIMVTAFDRERLLRDPNHLAVDLVLTKPVTSSCLYNAVVEVKHRKGSLDRRKRGSAEMKRLAGLRVLVVDDSEINRDVAEQILRSEGAQVEAAVDGSEALTMLKAGPGGFDVVLMDVQMPVMDGYTATREIRTTLGLAELPVIALTAGAFRSHRDAAREAGMDAFIAKPFDVDALVQTLLPHLRAATPGSPRLQEGGEGPSLPGADWAGTELMAPERGIRRFRSEEQYRRNLGIFLRVHERDGETIRQLLEGQDFDQSLQVTHRLRGAAATLALGRVAALAGELERALEDRADTSRLSEGLTSTFHVTVGEITRYLHGSPAAGPDPAAAEHPDGPEPEILAGRTLAALAQDDLDTAEALFAELEPHLEAALRVALRARLEEFDLRAAARLLRERFPGPN